MGVGGGGGDFVLSKLLLGVDVGLEGTAGGV